MVLVRANLIFWALREQGHERLRPAPYAKTNKNDYIDAEAGSAEIFTAGQGELDEHPNDPI